MKILVVEDEPKTGNYLKQGLSEAAFVVDLVEIGLQVDDRGIGSRIAHVLLGDVDGVGQFRVR